MMDALGEEPLATEPSLVTQASIVKELREMLPLMNADTATLKTVMQKLASRFELEFAELKAQWRPRIKALLPDMLGLCGAASKSESEKEDTDAEKEEEDEKETNVRLSRQRVSKKRNTGVDASDGGEEDAIGSDISEANEASSGGEDGVELKKRRTLSHTKKRKGLESALRAKKAKPALQPDLAGLSSLKELGRAAGVLNPQVYTRLKRAQSTEEAEEVLRERLHEAGITFQGSYPTSRDISAAKKKHAKEKELEGIDPSLIISGGRARRGGVRQISYKEDRISGEEENAEEEQEDDEEDAESDQEKQFAASDSDSSEATF